jgi:hypothetical protein
MVWSWAHFDNLAAVQVVLPSPVSGEGPGVRAGCGKKLLLDTRLQRPAMRRAAVWLAAAMMALTGCLSGCGPSGKKVWPVSGKVTYQGKPVAAGTIRFQKLDVDMTAGLRPDGGYEVIMAEGRGLPEGDYQVAVIPLSAIPGSPIPMGPIKAPLPKPVCRDIPQKYRDPSTSGLTLTVKPGNNPFDVDMRP